jgi:excisionase family DNA binding protein
MSKEQSPRVVAQVEATQTRLPDGRIVITPLRVADAREIGSREAARRLGLHPQTVHVLCAAGELTAWKMASRRGNAKWRISPASVDAYKEKCRNGTQAGH